MNPILRCALAAVVLSLTATVSPGGVTAHPLQGPAPEAEGRLMAPCYSFRCPAWLPPLLGFADARQGKVPILRSEG